MRITERKRFEKRVKVSDHRWFTWIRRRRCVNCRDDVWDEVMWRFRMDDEHGSWWAYLCKTCVLSKDAALTYWGEYEEGS